MTLRPGRTKRTDTKVVGAGGRECGGQKLCPGGNAAENGVHGGRTAVPGALTEAVEATNVLRPGKRGVVDRRVRQRFATSAMRARRDIKAQIALRRLPVRGGTRDAGHREPKC